MFQADLFFSSKIIAAECIKSKDLQSSQHKNWSHIYLLANKYKKKEFAQMAKFLFIINHFVSKNVIG